MAEAQKKAPNIVSMIVYGGIVGASLYFFMGGGVEKKVAADALEQYRIAKNSGNKMQACVHAGFVSAALLQAKDEKHYIEWQEVEKAVCQEAHEESEKEIEKKLWPNGRPTFDP